jgi:quinol monooxygenase YgiN
MNRTHLLEIDFQLQSEKRREFNLSLENLLAASGSGHVRASAYEDRDDGNRLLLVFEWSRRGDLEAYLESRPYLALLGCLKTLGQVADCRVVDLSDGPAAPGEPAGDLPGHPAGVAPADRVGPRWVEGRRAPPPSMPSGSPGKP